MKFDRKDLSPEVWARVDDVFDRMLDSEDPEAELAREPDPSVVREAGRLWRDHLRAQTEGFLKEPLELLKIAREGRLPSFAVGQVLDRRFTIEKLLGMGGMGEVYLARDGRLNGELVAIKSIRRVLAPDAKVRRRFVAELQNARRVTHNNVCRINEILGEHEMPFLSMEYLEGDCLSEWLEHKQEERERRRVALDLANGLAAAHRAGVLHCDFKPANVILVTRQKQLRTVITDFGLARALTDREGFDGVAGSSLRGWTRDYVAPELARGERPTVRSDVYSFGKVLEELLPGHRLATRCAAEEAQARPHSMDEVVRALEGGSTRRNWLMAAGAVTATGTVGYMLAPRSTFVMASRQRIVVSRFAPESDQANILRQLLITALRQSPVLTVVDDGRIRAVLAGLKRAGNTVEGRAAMVAAAAKLSALWVEGVADLVRGAVALKVFAPGETRPMVEVKALVGNRVDLVTLADQAAMRLRQEVGESGASRRAMYKPLGEVTSKAPEAVELYFRAVGELGKANGEDSITWTEQAIRLDPDFALAHLQMAISLAAHDRTISAMAPLERAYALRGRVSLRERLMIEARHFNMWRDYENYVKAARALVTQYPEEAAFQRNLAFALARTGQAKAADKYNKEALSLEPDVVTNKGELIANLANANSCDEALEWLGRFRQEGETSANLEWAAGIAHLGKDDAAAALECYRRMEADPLDRVWAGELRTGGLIVQGELAAAAREIAGNLALYQATGEEMRLHTGRCWLGMVECLLGVPAHGAEQVAELVKLEPNPALMGVLREAGILAVTAGAREYYAPLRDNLARVEAAYSSTHSKAARQVLEAVSLERGDDAAAAKLLHEAVALRGDPLTHFACAQWRMERAHWTVALEHLGKIEEQRGWIYHLYFPGMVMMARIWRAKCLAEMSLFEQSNRLYRQVMTLWRPAMQARIGRQVRDEYEKLIPNRYKETK